MKKVLFLCFLLIRLIVFSQNKTEVPIWVNSPSEQDKYVSCCFYYREKISFGNKEINEKKFKSKIDELEKELKTAISKKIQTSVKSFDIMEVKQVGINNKTELQTNYSSINTISTNVRTLGNNVKLEFWPTEYKKGLKELIGYIKIERNDLEKEYANIVRNELSILEAELVVNLEESNENLAKIKGRISILMSNVLNDLNILTSINVAADYSELHQKFIDSKKKYGQLINKLIGKEFEDNYRTASRLLQDKNCITAYERRSELYVINPDDSRVLEDKATALHCIESGMLSRIALFDNQTEFESALLTIASVCWLIPQYNNIYENNYFSDNRTI